MLILSQMAKQPDVVLSTTCLADTLHLTPPTVSKVLKILSDSQLVNSVRGADGGYHLAKAANTISLADIILAMEGDFGMTECCETANLCGLDALCTLRENWQKINGMVKGLLNTLTIADMLQPLTLQGLNNGK